LIAKSKKILVLEWKVTGAFFEGKDISFSELPVSALYFALFIDTNLNNSIDENELRIVQVKFR
jgi:hypothetical protein